MKALFKNPKAALAYVGITVVGAAMMIGTEDAPGSLHRTVGTLGDGATAQDRAAQRKFGDPRPSDTIGRPTRKQKPKSDEEAPLVGFASDEELIDDAQGFDPTPEKFEGFDASPDGEQPYLSDQDQDTSNSFGGWGSGTDLPDD